MSISNNSALSLFLRRGYRVSAVPTSAPLIRSPPNHKHGSLQKVGLNKKLIITEKDNACRRESRSGVAWKWPQLPKTGQPLTPPPPPACAIYWKLLVIGYIGHLYFMGYQTVREYLVFNYWSMLMYLMCCVRYNSKEWRTRTTSTTIEALLDSYL